MSVRGRPQINARTQDAATERDALSLGYSTLMGTVLTNQGPRAYLHLTGGRIHKVSPGDMIDGATIAAIENGAVVLTRNGEVRRMRMP